MNNVMRISFKAESLPYRRKLEILTESECNGFLPCSAAFNYPNVSLYYDAAGYRQVASFEKLSAAELLSIVRITLINIEYCRDYLFFPEEYILSAETVLVSADRKEIKFIYIPDCEKLSFHWKMKSFLHSLKSKGNESSKNYLNNIIELLESEKMRKEAVISYIDELISEVFICGII